MAWQLAKQIARTILSGFERHFALFQGITAGAMQRFEDADWPAVQTHARERIYFYDRRVNETILELRRRLHTNALDELLWQRVKVEYARLLHQYRQPELAETFYNSVFCHLFDRRYYNNQNIFVRPAISTEHIEGETPTYRCHYPIREGFKGVLEEILYACGFSLPFEDRRLDVANVLRRIRHSFPDVDQRLQNFQLAVLTAPFFRNKAAYVIGKVINGYEQVPFAIPVLNNEEGGLYVDSLLVGEAAIADVFSFSRAYFMVMTEVPSAVVEFLLGALPQRSKADIYTAIGFQKHGKTEFYRDFLRHLRYSSDDFIIAPGIKGMVMTVFTLPSYPYVFKVIKDKFPSPKEVTRDDVKRKYRLVKQHDRVGRMADSWEYSYAALPLARFSPELLAELRSQAGSSLTVEEDQAVIHHVYIERRMTPLNMYLDHAEGLELTQAIEEYGSAIKQLAGVDIFPGDMLFKNFGVTRQGRVVFYDYDEICYLTECRFRHIPEPPYPEYEMAAEPWYSVGPNDVFPEEFATFLLADPRLRVPFLSLHRDLLDADYWIEKQAKIRDGLFEDVFPYQESLRFPRRSRHPGTGRLAGPQRSHRRLSSDDVRTGRTA